MRANESRAYYAGTVTIMTDMAIIKATAKVTLLDIAKQAKALGTGLQNAAPADKSGTPNNSIQYLFSVAECLATLAENCDTL
jgi:hypothetical protein